MLNPEEELGYICMATNRHDMSTAAPERAKAIQAEVQKLIEAWIMREVYYHDWLSNPVMIRAKEVSGWIPDFLEEDDEEDESNDDTLDNESDGEKTKKTCKPILSMNGSSKATLKYPSGFTPNDVLRSKDVQDVVKEVEVHVLKQKSNVQVNSTKDNSFRGVTHSKKEDKESYCSGYFSSSEGPQTGGSILQVKEDLVKVGQTMGYQMEGCVSNIEEIIRIRRENESYQ
nr:reverse transcriptase domain-containing protein [Tanacetum cinerariifolium]